MEKPILSFTVAIGKQEINAQDPGFSQFFSSPLNVNPVLEDQFRLARDLQLS